ncbi:hypothetical protein [Argonema antarcticum]|uniref:hypothetical protein n=1 Tax=Argonema antarcticum TaxID=2942763 RepID=UPI0020128158|nr:hypothetical protein [Argonema antarcticum]MCL1472559.1 hypothetical protein [Argonema antarcticum A004/B2]
MDFHLDNLLNLEKQVMNYLAKQEDAVTLMQVLQSISHPPTEVLKAIQSLKIRCLLEDTPNCDRSSLPKNELKPPALDVGM